MTGRDTARAFLDSVRGFVAPPAVSETELEWRPVRLATVDPLYTGSGRPKVLFDGETVMGVRTYSWLGRKPFSSERVAMLPQGHSYIIAGSLDAQPTTAAGVVTITPVANTPTGVAVVFPAGRFQSAPSVVATAVSSSAAVTNASVQNITATGCTIYLLRTNTTTTDVNWQAVAI